MYLLFDILKIRGFFVTFISSQKACFMAEYGIFSEILTKGFDETNSKEKVEKMAFCPNEVS